jgi:GT2 family glycosyltransferase
LKDRPLCSAVIVGHNKWDEFTLPLITSLWEHEPNLPITVVDNGSDPPYPQYKNINIVIGDNHSYARALNQGIADAGNAEWYLLINNDVICQGPFLYIVDGFHNDTAYGATTQRLREHIYLVGWCIFVNSKIYRDVGPFDESFKPWGYADVDYSYRIVEAGFQLEQVDLPFKHYQYGSHEYLGDMTALRKKNQMRFLKKHGLEIPE